MKVPSSWMKRPFPVAWADLERPPKRSHCAAWAQNSSLLNEPAPVGIQPSSGTPVTLGSSAILRRVARSGSCGSMPPTSP